MNRRTLLSGVALLPLLGLTACPAGLPQTPAQWAQDVALIAGWMPTVTSAVGMLTNVPAATVAQINKWAALIVTGATQVANETASIVTGTSTAAIVKEDHQL